MHMVAPTFDQQVLARLPLAEAVLLALRHATLPEHCQELFDRLHGPCYTHLLTFDTFVHLVEAALLRYRGSGRQACAQAKEQDLLPTSHQAFYGKLSRLPLPVSEAFLADSTARLACLLPPSRSVSVPDSLRSLRIQVLDGKVLKRVAKRLKVLRKLPGGALGGKGLVCWDLHNGLVSALASTADGHTNDCALVPALLAQVRPKLDGCVLWLADCQFCDLNQLEQFAQDDHHFLVRYHPKTQFCPDPSRPAQQGTDRRGRHFRQEWGWLGRPANPRRRYVRRLSLERPGEKAVVLVSDLLDETLYPADDLLELYLMRWGIEGIFQKITEVFSLSRLISSSPQGTVFQLAFCLLLYNLIQLVRGYIAAGQQLAVDEVSTEMLFEDVREELTALHKVVGAQAIPALLPEQASSTQVRARLEQLLSNCWRPIWRKTTNKKRRAHQPKGRARGHVSVQRVLEKSRHEKKPELVGDRPCQ